MEDNQLMEETAIDIFKEYTESTWNWRNKNRKNGGAIIKSLSILQEYLWECILLSFKKKKFQRILAT